MKDIVRLMQEGRTPFSYLESMRKGVKNAKFKSELCVF